MARTFQPEQGQFQNNGETPRPGQVASPLGYHAHLELEVIRETVEQDGTDLSGDVAMGWVKTWDP